MSAARPASAIPGVRYGAIARHADSRGSFRELWRASAFGAIEPADAGPGGGAFVQANLSTSAAGVLRGLHYHRRQLDYWVVVSGRAFVAVVDVRPVRDRAVRDRAVVADRAVVVSSGAVAVETRELRADDWIVIPAGVAHGFLAVEPLELLYLVTNEYDGSDELGFAWDDPAVGVQWPRVAGTTDGRPILSDRDRSNPSLAELVARL